MKSSPIASTNHVFTLLANGNETIPLRAGETIMAEVVSVGKDESAKIRMKNTVVEVQSDIVLHKGDTLMLRVERQENTINLRLAGSAPEQINSARNTLLSALNSMGEKVSGPDGMTNLVTVLSKLPAGIQMQLPEVGIVGKFVLEMEQLNGNTLKSIVDDGGIFFENKLRVLALGIEAEGMNTDIEAGRIIAGDLKASLLRLKDTFLTVPGLLDSIKGMIRPGELIDALNTVLKNIEFYQLQSKMTDTLQFFLPLVWRQLRDGEVILRESDRGAPGDRSYSCTINLDLDGIGKLQVNLLLQGGYIHVNCAAESERFSRLLKEGADSLQSGFSNAGIRLGHLNVRHQPSITFDRAQVSGLSIRA